MKMLCQVDKAHGQQGLSVFLKEDCPFHRRSNNSCLAAGSSLPVTAARRQLCCSDDHDRCPVYLACLLRHSRALAGDRDGLKDI